MDHLNHHAKTLQCSFSLWHRKPLIKRGILRHRHWVPSRNSCVLTPPCVTFRRVAVSLRGPGQSPVLPFACCVGSLRSVGRCGRCSCWCRFRVRGAPSLVCRGCAGCSPPPQTKTTRLLYSWTSTEHHRGRRLTTNRRCSRTSRERCVSPPCYRYHSVSQGRSGGYMAQQCSKTLGPK